MQRFHAHLRGLSTLGALAALCLALPLTAQEPEQDKTPPPIDIKLPPVLNEQSSDEDIDARLEELIRDVEKQLRGIDRLLENAAAGGEGAAQAAREAGAAAKSMSELMKRSKSESEAAVKSIDEILELASIPKQNKSNCSSGNCSSLRKSVGKKPGSSQSGETAQGQPGSQQPGADKQSPLAGSRDATTQREKTGDGREAGQNPQGGKQQMAGGKPQGKPGQNGQPDGNKASDQPASMQEGAPPPGADKGAVANNANTAETWGFLPEHARDVFRSQGGGEYPARYRDWIDSYYKKLNQRP